MKNDLDWIPRIFDAFLIIFGVAILVRYMFFSSPSEPYVAPVDRISQAVTSHFGTENWILEDQFVLFKEQPYYLISTNDGSYKVVLNADNTKVIKAVKDQECTK